MKNKILILTLILFITQFYAQELTWVNTMGGTDAAAGGTITTDLNGAIYTAGYFFGTVDFDPAASVFELTAQGSSDVFIQKTDADGNFVWAYNFGNTNAENAGTLFTDNQNNVYLTGGFRGTVDFDPGVNDFSLTSNGETDAFILKLNEQGNFLWASQFGGAGNGDAIGGIAVDPSNNIYISGSFSDNVDFDPSPANDFTLTAQGLQDRFVLKLDDGLQFVWAKQLGGTEAVGGGKIAIDATNAIVVQGSFFGTVDFDTSATNEIRTTNGSSDMYIQKLNSEGNHIWVATFGGIENDEISTLQLDAANHIYATGTFRETVDFNPSGGGDIRDAAGSRDIFVQKYDSDGSVIWTQTIGGTGFDDARCLSLHDNGTLFIAGKFNDTVDFDPGPNTANATTNTPDIYLLQLDTNGAFVGYKTITGSSFDNAFGSAISAANELYITGNFMETIDFDASGPMPAITATGMSDIFVLKFGNPSLGISSTSLVLEGITAFPNPTNGGFSLGVPNALGSVDVTITNLVGQRILSRQFQQNKNMTLTLPEASGVYFCTVTSAGASATIKMIKN